MKSIIKICFVIIILIHNQAYSDWQTIFQKPSCSLLKMHFLSDDVGMTVGGYSLAGYDSSIFRTSNGGGQWNNIPSGSSTDYLQSIFFADNSTGFSGGKSIKFVKTTNGGLTWNLINIGSSPNTIEAMYFLNATTGFICADGDNYIRILKTTNSGISFTEICFINNKKRAAGLHFIDANIGFCPNQYGVLKTTNGGFTWFNVTDTLKNCKDIKVTNNGIYVCGSQSSGSNTFIIKSTDSGVNWSTIYSANDSTSIYSITASPINSDYLFAVGYKNLPYNKGILLTSSNNGSIWQQAFIFDDTTTFKQVISTNNKIYILGSLRGVPSVFKNDLSIGIQNISTEIPKSFKLEQNYPNPFNPATQIEFAVFKKDFIKITVFDITGRVIEKLVNQELKAGTYKVDFNADSYSSGMYFYRLETNGYSETKKMVLIK